MGRKKDPANLVMVRTQAVSSTVRYTGLWI